MSIYFDGKGNIRPELLGTESEDVAKTFLFPGQGKALNSAQLRRFYGDLKNLERIFECTRLAKSETDPFLSILPLVKMVKSKTSYASKKVPPEFGKWLNKHISTPSRPPTISRPSCSISKPWSVSAMASA